MTFFPFGALVPSVTFSIRTSSVVKFSVRTMSVPALGQLFLSRPYQLNITHMQQGQVGLALGPGSSPQVDPP